MDYIFLIWRGILDELNTFIAKINKVHPSIKFDFNYSSSSVNFLDTTVKSLPRANFPPLHFKRKQIVKLIFKEMRTPRVFKTQYSICPIPTSKISMHQRLRFQSQLWHFVEKPYR